MNETLENAAIVAGKTATYGGAAGAVLGGLTISELGITIGAIVGILGWVCSQYWSWRRDQRAAAADNRAAAADLRDKAESDLRMTLMRTTGAPIMPPAKETEEAEHE